MDEELARTVGQRIRRLRQRGGISLRRQAELVGVLRPRCRCSRTAVAACRSPPFSVSPIISDCQSPSCLRPRPRWMERLTRTQYWSRFSRNARQRLLRCRRGAGTLYQLLGAGKGHLLQPYILSFLPGQGYAPDPIGHAGEEFAYVVVGAVDLLLSEEVHRLRQGDAVRFRTETPHSLRNASTSGIAVVVGAATPPW